MFLIREWQQQQPHRSSSWHHSNVNIWTHLIVPLILIRYGSIFICAKVSNVIISCDAFSINTISSSTYTRKRSLNRRFSVPPTAESHNNEKERGDHATIISNENEVDVESKTPIATVVMNLEPNNRRQQLRSFFRRFFRNNAVAVTVRKLLVWFKLRLPNQCQERSKSSNHKGLMEGGQVRVVDEIPYDVASSSTLLDSTISSTSTAKLHDARNNYEQWNGKWNIIISDEFMQEYDTYLQRLGQPYLVRSIAKNIIGATNEETSILSSTCDDCNVPSLLLRSINARGVWERTLVASDIFQVKSTSSIECKDTDATLTLLSNYTYPKTSINTTIVTADNERVTAEAWWIFAENDSDSDTICGGGGRIYHHSWLRGVTKYGGGDFESIRYLEQQPSYDKNINDDQDGSQYHHTIASNILVCRSTFHPVSNSQKQREAARVTWRFIREC